jgi:hypothetical protein
VAEVAVDAVVSEVLREAAGVEEVEVGETLRMLVEMVVAEVVGAAEGNSCLPLLLLDIVWQEVRMYHLLLSYPF